jgi:asparagine synthase (glutamine-hydrolysing)
MSVARTFLIFEPELLQAVPPERWMHIAQLHYDTGKNRSELNRILYMDAKMTLADNDIRKVLGTAELAGVRARFPLLDPHLVELASRIPTKWKVRGFEKRYIFKQAMKGILPSKVLHKKKHGFGVPVSLWLLEDARLESLMKDVMTDSKTRQRGYFRPSFIDQVMRCHRSEDAKNFGEVLWYLLMLELWHREHFEGKLEQACAS